MASVISGDANVSATEFGYLDGVTAALQGQVDSKLDLAGGKILQTIANTHSTAVAISGTSFLDIGLSATITPSASNSKILVMYSALVDARSTGAQSGARLKVFRDATSIAEGLSDGDIFINAATSATFTILTGRITGFILDTPTTTSSTVYKLQGCGSQADDTATFQRNNNTSYLVLMEVSA